MILWISGNSGSGKTTLAKRICKPDEVILDGDELRKVWTDLDLSKAGRLEQNYRAMRLAKMLSEQGISVIVATICPFKEQRKEIEQAIGCRFVYLEGGREGKEYPYER